MRLILEEFYYYKMTGELSKGPACSLVIDVLILAPALTGWAFLLDMPPLSASASTSTRRSLQQL